MKHLLLLPFLLFFKNTPSPAPVCVSGVVNQYTPVWDFACEGNTVVVESSVGFAAGDLVLLIQMQGAECVTNNTAQFGDLTAINHAGNYEINRIESVVANRINLRYLRTRDYDLAGRVQLIRIPEYDDVSVCDLTCLPWNGETGGVCAIRVYGTLTLDGPIDVSGRGFRGGEKIEGTQVSNHETDYVAAPNPNRFAQKGEGIVELPTAQSCGRGKAINGGGGGNAHNAGGGGGAGMGNGGRGGMEFSHDVPNPDTYGAGGLRLADYPDRLFMGGGGGAGQTNDGKGSSGGAGGGIALVLANEIVTNNRRVFSNGGDVVGGNVHNDGQGGGGAGGTIAIWAETITGILRTEQRGGRGGNSTFQSQRIGPGGGGGGGRLIRYHSTPQVYEDVEGGVHGLTANIEAYGATNGEAGGIDMGVFIPLDTILLEINPQITLTDPDCSGVANGSIAVSLPGAVSYQLGGVTNTNGLFEQLDTGAYTILIEYEPSCFVDVAGVLEAGNVSYTYEQVVFCAGSSVEWQGVTYTDSAQIELVLPSSADCDSILVTNIIALPLPTTTRTLTLCPGQSVTIGGVAYTSAATVTDTLRGQETACDTVRTTSIVLEPLVGAFLSADTSLCAGDQVTLRSQLPDTRWPGGTRGATFLVGTPGLYVAEATSPAGCPLTDSVRVVSCCAESGMYVPNAFSPDDNGQNDQFLAFPTERCRQYTLRVYDRWGELLFESDQPDVGWDGTFRGQKMPAAVYVWVIEFGGTERGLRRTGDVHLIR
jgi:gliding motility-associated-like protein